MQKSTLDHEKRIGIRTEVDKEVKRTEVNKGYIARIVDNVQKRFKSEVLQSHFENNFSSHLAQRIACECLRRIKARRKCLREVPMFADTVRNYVIFLHEYNMTVYKSSHSYPHSDEFSQMLLQYVLIECQILYKRQYFCKERETQVQNKILRLLINIYTDYFKSKLTPRKEITEKASKAIFDIFVELKLNFLRGDYGILENMTAILLKKIGRYEKINALKNNIIPRVTDSALTIFSTNVITSDYGPDESSNETSSIYLDEEDVQFNQIIEMEIKDKIEENAISISPQSNPKLVWTICLDEEGSDNDVLFCSEEVESRRKFKRKNANDPTSIHNLPYLIQKNIKESYQSNKTPVKKQSVINICINRLKQIDDFMDSMKNGPTDDEEDDDDKPNRDLIIETHNLNGTHTLIKPGHGKTNNFNEIPPDILAKRISAASVNSTNRPTMTITNIEKEKQMVLKNTSEVVKNNEKTFIETTSAQTSFKIIDAIELDEDECENEVSRTDNDINQTTSKNVINLKEMEIEGDNVEKECMPTNPNATKHLPDKNIITEDQFEANTTVVSSSCLVSFTNMCFSKCDDEKSTTTENIKPSTYTSNSNIVECGCIEQQNLLNCSYSEVLTDKEIECITKLPSKSDYSVNEITSKADVQEDKAVDNFNREDILKQISEDHLSQCRSGTSVKYNKIQTNRDPNSHFRKDSNMRLEIQKNRTCMEPEYLIAISEAISTKKEIIKSSTKECLDVDSVIMEIKNHEKQKITVNVNNSGEEIKILSQYSISNPIKDCSEDQVKKYVDKTDGNQNKLLIEPQILSIHKDGEQTYENHRENEIIQTSVEPISGHLPEDSVNCSVQLKHVASLTDKPEDYKNNQITLRIDPGIMEIQEQISSHHRDPDEIIQTSVEYIPKDPVNCLAQLKPISSLTEKTEDYSNNHNTLRVYHGILETQERISSHHRVQDKIVQTTVEYIPRHLPKAQLKPIAPLTVKLEDYSNNQNTLRVYPGIMETHERISSDHRVQDEIIQTSVEYIPRHLPKAQLKPIAPLTDKLKDYSNNQNTLTGYPGIMETQEQISSDHRVQDEIIQTSVEHIPKQKDVVNCFSKLKPVSSITKKPEYYNNNQNTLRVDPGIMKIQKRKSSDHRAQDKIIHTSVEYIPRHLSKDAVNCSAQLKPIAPLTDKLKVYNNNQNTLRVDPGIMEIQEQRSSDHRVQDEVIQISVEHISSHLPKDAINCSTQLKPIAPLTDKLEDYSNNHNTLRIDPGIMEIQEQISSDHRVQDEVIQTSVEHISSHLPKDAINCSTQLKHIAPLTDKLEDYSNNHNTLRVYPGKMDTQERISSDHRVQDEIIQTSVEHIPKHLPKDVVNFLSKLKPVSSSTKKLKYYNNNQNTLRVDPGIMEIQQRKSSDLRAQEEIIQTSVEYIPRHLSKDPVNCLAQLKPISSLTDKLEDYSNNHNTLRVYPGKMDTEERISSDHRVQDEIIQTSVEHIPKQKDVVNCFSKLKPVLSSTKKPKYYNNNQNTLRVDPGNMKIQKRKFSDHRGQDKIIQTSVEYIPRHLPKDAVNCSAQLKPIAPLTDKLEVYNNNQNTLRVDPGIMAIQEQRSSDHKEQTSVKYIPSPLPTDPFNCSAQLKPIASSTKKPEEYNNNRNYLRVDLGIMKTQERIPNHHRDQKETLVTSKDISDKIEFTNSSITKDITPTYEYISSDYSEEHRQPLSETTVKNQNTPLDHLIMPDIQKESCHTYQENQLQDNSKVGIIHADPVIIAKNLFSSDNKQILSIDTIGRSEEKSVSETCLFMDFKYTLHGENIIIPDVQEEITISTYGYDENQTFEDAANTENREKLLTSKDLSETVSNIGKYDFNTNLVNGKEIPKCDKTRTIFNTKKILVDALKLEIPKNHMKIPVTSKKNINKSKKVKTQLNHQNTEKTDKKVEIEQSLNTTGIFIPVNLQIENDMTIQENLLSNLDLYGVETEKSDHNICKPLEDYTEFKYLIVTNFIPAKQYLPQVSCGEVELEIPNSDIVSDWNIHNEEIIMETSISQSDHPNRMLSIAAQLKQQSDAPNQIIPLKPSKKKPKLLREPRVFAVGKTQPKSTLGKTEKIHITRSRTRQNITDFVKSNRLSSLESLSKKLRYKL